MSTATTDNTDTKEPKLPLKVTPVTNDRTRRFVARLTAPTLKKLRMTAAARDVPMSHVLAELIEYNLSPVSEPTQDASARS